MASEVCEPVCAPPKCQTSCRPVNPGKCVQAWLHLPVTLFKRSCAATNHESPLNSVMLFANFERCRQKCEAPRCAVICHNLRARGRNGTVEQPLKVGLCACWSKHLERSVVEKQTRCPVLSTQLVSHVRSEIAKGAMQLFPSTSLKSGCGSTRPGEALRER